VVQLWLVSCPILIRFVRSVTSLACAVNRLLLSSRSGWTGQKAVTDDDHQLLLGLRRMMDACGEFCVGVIENDSHATISLS
jgi:hypothetical protein